MQRFFENMALLDAFTCSLDYHQDCLECEHCSKNGQLVSHGFIYKQRSQRVSEPIGKRLFCSNRYGRTGCGRTFQLYVASEFPSFGQLDSRSAWRWINKLLCRLCDYRSFLKTRAESASNLFTSSSRRLQILLPTLARLFSSTGNCACSHYQLVSQKPFI